MKSRSSQEYGVRGRFGARHGAHGRAVAMWAICTFGHSGRDGERVSLGRTPVRVRKLDRRGTVRCALVRDTHTDDLDLLPGHNSDKPSHNRPSPW
jgi:hypothetical protein